MSYFSHNYEVEQLYCDSIDEAMQEYVDDVDHSKWDKQVEIYRYEPMKISDAQKQRWSEWALENLIENLDEEHGDPDGETTITKEMETAAREFVDKVIAGYHVWSCEKVETIKVDLVEWYNALPGEEDEEGSAAIERLKATP